MTTPIIWIFIPAVISLVLWFLPELRKARLTIALLVSIALAIFARYLPIGSVFHIGPWPVKIQDTLSILGRTLTLGTEAQPILIFFYLLTSIWFLGGLVVKANTIVAPLGLAMVALLVSALAVVPFLFGALLFEMAVIASVLVLSPPGQAPTQGVLRYLIFQTLGVPFILFSGWMLNTIESGVNDQTLIVRTSIILGFGFAFLLAVFPFNTWIPLLTGQTEPYLAGFVLAVIPMAAFLFALNFIDFYSWLRNEVELYTVLRFAGVLTVAVGGIAAAFQRHLGRVLGYFIIVETGLSLISISLKDIGGLQVFSTLFLPRVFGVWVLSLALGLMKQKTGNLDFNSVKGKLREFPFIAGSVLVAEFSLVGLPLFASFPVEGPLLTTLYSISPIAALWSFAGLLGLLVAAFRSMNAFTFQVVPETWRIKEQGGEAFLLTLGSLGLLILGVFPQVFLPPLIKLLGIYPHLL